jgi:hypothetical protein
LAQVLCGAEEAVNLVQSNQSRNTITKQTSALINRTAYRRHA